MDAKFLVLSNNIFSYTIFIKNNLKMLKLWQFETFSLISKPNSQKLLKVQLCDIFHTKTCLQSAQVLTDCIFLI